MRRIKVVLGIPMVVALAASCGGSDTSDTTTTLSPGTDSSDTTSPGTASTEPSVASSATSSTLPSDDPLVLYGTGIGFERFGASADHAVSTFTKLLGSPSDDRVETAFSSSYGVCPGNKVRIVEWGGLVLLFTDGETEFAPARDEFTFFEWRIRDLGDATPPLVTLNGSGIGDFSYDLEDAEGSDLEIFEDDFLGTSFTIGGDKDGIRGTLMTTEIDAVVVGTMAAGSSCGE